MFTFGEALNQPWYLSTDKRISIPKHVELKNQDIIAINFLCQNYKNKFKGSILNEEKGFDVQAQVSTFLQVIFNTWSKPKGNFCALVITHGYLLQKWNEKLELIGGLKVQIVGPKTCPKDFDKEHGLALLLSFDYIKYADTLSEYNFACVVIDHFDIVASKLVIRRLAGDFNIGLTRRNFYINPDQKLQWTMLNWVHPGSVGRLIDFYECDNDNFSNLRDNYHHWWLVLTWDYCESFKRPKEDESDESLKEIKHRKKITRRKKIAKKLKSKISDDSTDNDEADTHMHNSIEINDKLEPIMNKTNQNTLNINQEKSDGNKKMYIKESSNSSNDTIEFNESAKANNSINQLSDEDDLLLNIIQGVSGQNRSESLDRQTQVNLKKEELYSQIFDDVPESKMQNSEDSEDFLLSLINN